MGDTIARGRGGGVTLTFRKCGSFACRQRMLSTGLGEQSQARPTSLLPAARPSRLRSVNALTLERLRARQSRVSQVKSGLWKMVPLPGAGAGWYAGGSSPGPGGWHPAPGGSAQASSRTPLLGSSHTCPDVRSLTCRGKTPPHVSSGSCRCMDGGRASVSPPCSSDRQ